jgi:hypothetical protein
VAFASLANLDNVLAALAYKRSPWVTELNPVPPPVTSNPVQLVSIPDAGVPKSGAISVGPVARTGAPVPVTVTQEGTLEPLDNKPALGNAAISSIVLLADEKSIRLIVDVEGHVVVENAGAELAPD